MDLLSVLQRGNWQRIEEAKRNFKLNTGEKDFLTVDVFCHADLQGSAENPTAWNMEVSCMRKNS